LLSFVLLFAGGCGDECQQDPTAYAFDERGPWGETPADLFGHTEASMSGRLTWFGPLIEEEIEPDVAETSVTLELTLDPSSATGVRDRLVGACDGRLEIDATLSIVTDDGALDESIPLVLAAEPGSNHVNARVDLTGYDFVGTLELNPGWVTHELLLGLSWDRHGGMTGVIRTGDALDTQDPDVKSGIYAMIVAND
jgi:hypothetical protein